MVGDKAGLLTHYRRHQREPLGPKHTELFSRTHTCTTGPPSAHPLDLYLYRNIVDSYFLLGSRTFIHSRICLLRDRYT